MKLLTNDEIDSVLSMNRYWEEVNQRLDKTPLQQELLVLVRFFGTRLLFIVADYAKGRKETPCQNKQ